MVKQYTLADIDIPTAGTRVQVSATDIRVSSVVFQAKSTNSGNIYVGDSNVSSTRGVGLAAGQTYTVVADQSGRWGGEELTLSDFYVDTATNGNDVSVCYMARK